MMGVFRKIVVDLEKHKSPPETPHWFEMKLRSV